MSDNDLYKLFSLDDLYHPSRTKCDFKSSYHKQRSAKLQSFNKLPELFDLADAGKFLTL